MSSEWLRQEALQSCIEVGGGLMNLRICFAMVACSEVIARAIDVEVIGCFGFVEKKIAAGMEDRWCQGLNLWLRWPFPGMSRLFAPFEPYLTVTTCFDSFHN